MIEHMFDDEVVLTAEEYEDFLIACHETEFGDDYPDAADSCATNSSASSIPGRGC